MVMSDFRLELEIKYGHFLHPQWKICNITVIIRTVWSLWTSLWGRYHVPQNVFIVVINVIGETRSSAAIQWTELYYQTLVLVAQFFSRRLHLSCDDFLEDKNCSLLCCSVCCTCA